MKKINLLKIISIIVVLVFLSIACSTSDISQLGAQPTEEQPTQAAKPTPMQAQPTSPPATAKPAQLPSQDVKINPSFKILNKTTKTTICAVYAAIKAGKDQGNNLLGSKTVAPGANFDISLPAGTYDITLKDCAGKIIGQKLGYKHSGDYSLPLTDQIVNKTYTSPVNTGGLDCTNSCGDGVCSIKCNENAQTCPADCNASSLQNSSQCKNSCGDSVCSSACGENAQTCPADCNANSLQGGSECKNSCGDSVCSSACGENAQTCPADCSSNSLQGGSECKNSCGDSVCSSACGENAQTCPADCNASSLQPGSSCANSCGDSICSSACGENAQTCPWDCN